jgi:hypothetical protein
MSAPETTPEAPTPVPVQLDPGIDLLQQAFNEAGELGNVLLAAKVGGGLARIQGLLRRVGVLEQQLASALERAIPPGEPPPAAPPPPVEEPAPVESPPGA